jgi:hypothetical protein
VPEVRRPGNQPRLVREIVLTIVGAIAAPAGAIALTNLGAILSRLVGAIALTHLGAILSRPAGAILSPTRRPDRTDTRERYRTDLVPDRT